MTQVSYWLNDSQMTRCREFNKLELIPAFFIIVRLVSLVAIVIRESMKKLLSLTLFLGVLVSCQNQKDQKIKTDQTQPFIWENATVYFLLTDRFYNADTTNDIHFDRKQDGGILRNFEGGDLKGIIAKIDEGYFDELGVNALWFSPVMEQIHGAVDEGTGNTYAYHGYWPRDWTSIEPNWGTKDELKELVKKAHDRGIRVILDVIINHTGPVSEVDSQWPNDWVRTSPTCDYKTKENTISCTLVENLPDVRTASDENVALPGFLLEKWKNEGRLEEELSSLDDFFDKTGYPRAPRFYIMKWLADYVRELGIDGFRVDTAKHTEASIWAELYKIASAAFDDWKKEHPQEVLDDQEFFMVGEVYNYAIGHGKDFAYDDGQTVNFFENGFQSLISFSAKYDASGDLSEMFQRYSDQLHGVLKGKTVMNYLASHDDSGSYDKERTNAYHAANVLLLAPGQAQIYYGDETGRKLIVEGAEGDANLRSMMNWGDLEKENTQALLDHWKKLGQFRQAHPSIGAGIHEMIQKEPFVFSRILKNKSISDSVLVVLNYQGGDVSVGSVFKDGTEVKDYYGKQSAIVQNGKIAFDKVENGVLLLAE